MASVFSLALVFRILSSLLSLSTIGKAQESQTPHGLIYENPLSLSPSAVGFFHPSYTVSPSDRAEIAACAVETECSHLAALSASSKARAESVPDTEWVAPASSNGRISDGNVVAIVVGLAFAVFVAMGASCVLVKHRVNSRKANPIVQPDA